MSEKVELTIEQKIEAIANILKSQATGRIEPWQGSRGPMFNVFLKNNGQNPSGVKNYPTVLSLAKGALESLRGSKYFIRFKFQLPDGSGGKLEQNATLVSAPDQGYLVFAGRESHNVSFSVSVEKVESKPKINNIETTSEGEIDLGLGLSAGSEITIG